MNYILDTHTIIWYFEKSSKIPPKITDIINNEENKIFISSVSLWELVLKLNSGKLKMDFSFEVLLLLIKKGGFRILQINDEYLINLSSLPKIHNDPFDRLIVSTACSNDLTIITIDKNIHKYDVSCIW